MNKRFENDRTTHNPADDSVFQVDGAGNAEKAPRTFSEEWAEWDRPRAEASRAAMAKNIAEWNASSLLHKVAQYGKLALKGITTVVIALGMIIAFQSIASVNNAPKKTQTEVVNFKTYIVKRHLHSEEDCYAALAKNNVYAGYEIATWRDTDGNLHPCVVLNTVEVSNG